MKKTVVFFLVSRFALRGQGEEPFGEAKNKRNACTKENDKRRI